MTTPTWMEQPHPCETTGCDHTVPFDDEPWCFDHSPNSGSTARGYSYKAMHAERIKCEARNRDAGGRCQREATNVNRLCDQHQGWKP